jgi:hypothetical protein
MKKLGKLLLFLISLAPIGTWVLLFIVLQLDFNFNETQIYSIMAAFALIPVLWVVYIANVFRNTTIASNQKSLWVALLFLFNFVIFPVYWYLHIWRDNDKPEGEPLQKLPPPVVIRPTVTRSRTAKIILLCANFTPIVLLALAIYIVGFTTYLDFTLYFLGILFLISSLAMFVYSIYDIYHNRTVVPDQRITWTLVLIAGGILVFPLYWYLHIWKEPAEVLD